MVRQPRRQLKKHVVTRGDKTPVARGAQAGRWSGQGAGSTESTFMKRGITMRDRPRAGRLPGPAWRADSSGPNRGESAGAPWRHTRPNRRAGPT